MDDDEIELRRISGSPVRDEVARRRRMELWKGIDARVREQAAGASNVDPTNVVFLSRFPTKEPVCIICRRAASFAENFFPSQGRYGTWYCFQHWTDRPRLAARTARWIPLR